MIQRRQRPAGQTGASKRSPEITAAMEAVYIRAKELNRVGALAELVGQRSAERVQRMELEMAA